MKLNIFRQPFPIHTWRWYRLRGFIYGVFVFLFLFLFKPFNLHLYDTTRLFYSAVLYGSITTLVILGGGYIFVKVIMERIKEENWTLGKHILYLTILMICIALANTWLTGLIYKVRLPVSWYFSMLKWVLMLGVLPVVIAELITYNRYLRQHLNNAKQLSQLIETENKTIVNTYPDDAITGSIIKPSTFTQPDGLVAISGENQSDKLVLPYSKLLAVQTLDNYVNVFWEEHGRLQTTLLRNTLTNIVGQLKNISCIYKTHRGWLVNVERVNRIEGSAQGLKLQVDLLRNQIPVSRSNISGFRKICREKVVNACKKTPPDGAGLKVSLS
ncbi:MAG: LytTR family transcriptional regulator DNA-binding domain-containing protein [Chitinophagaceae bacterium]|nr:LytTR family transcriptional regulator DNA-binding domain-containing protein [Chitinophagaceae bacterium]MCW5928944.1 LytTR family transcriptional regulator DNA-binding domain-containing protein [Chitinophagaceae bacterium]